MTFVFWRSTVTYWELELGPIRIFSSALLTILTTVAGACCCAGLRFDGAEDCCTGCLAGGLLADTDDPARTFDGVGVGISTSLALAKMGSEEIRPSQSLRDCKGIQPV